MLTETLSFIKKPRGVVPLQKKATPPEGLGWELFQDLAPRRKYTDIRGIQIDYRAAKMGNNATHELDIAHWALDIKYLLHVDAYLEKIQ